MKSRIAPALGIAVAALALAGLRPAPADEKGEALLREAFRTLHAARTYQAAFSLTIAPTGAPPLVLKGNLAAMKPNFFRLKLDGEAPGGGPKIGLNYVSDGKYYYQHGGGPTYGKDEVEPNPTQFAGRWEGEVDAFFGGDKLLGTRTVTVTGAETVGGVPCDLLKVSPQQNGPAVVYAVGKIDHLIRRCVLTFEGGGRTLTQTNLLTEVKINESKKPEDFVFTPPAGVREQFANLVPVGKPAPDFNLPELKGGQVALSDLRKGKKAVLVNFWFYN